MAKVLLETTRITRSWGVTPLWSSVYMRPHINKLFCCFMTSGHSRFRIHRVPLLHIWNFIAKYTLCNIVSAIIELTYLAYISGNFHKIITKVVPDPMFSRSRNTLKYMQYNRMYCNIQPKYNLIYNRHIYSICTIYAIQLLFSLSRISIDTLFGSWITHSSYKLWSTSHHIASCTVAANSC